MGRWLVKWEWASHLSSKAVFWQTNAGPSFPSTLSCPFGFPQLLHSWEPPCVPPWPQHPAQHRGGRAPGVLRSVPRSPMLLEFNCSPSPGPDRRHWQKQHEGPSQNFLHSLLCMEPVWCVCTKKGLLWPKFGTSATTGGEGKRNIKENYFPHCCRWQTGQGLKEVHLVS